MRTDVGDRLAPPTRPIRDILKTYFAGPQASVLTSVLIKNNLKIPSGVWNCIRTSMSERLAVIESEFRKGMRTRALELSGGRPASDSSTSAQVVGARVANEYTSPVSEFKAKAPASDWLSRQLRSPCKRLAPIEISILIIAKF